MAGESFAHEEDILDQGLRKVLYDVKNIILPVDASIGSLETVSFKGLNQDKMAFEAAEKGLEEARNRARDALKHENKVVGYAEKIEQALSQFQRAHPSLSEEHIIAAEEHEIGAINASRKFKQKLENAIMEIIRLEKLVQTAKKLELNAEDMRHAFGLRAAITTDLRQLQHDINTLQGYLSHLFQLKQLIESEVAKASKETQSASRLEYAQVSVWIISNDAELRNINLTSAPHGYELVYSDIKDSTFKPFYVPRQLGADFPTIVFHGRLANPGQSTTNYMQICAPIGYDEHRRMATIYIFLAMPESAYKAVVNNPAELIRLLETRLPGPWISYLARKEVRYGPGWQENKKTIFTCPMRFQQS